MRRTKLTLEEWKAKVATSSHIRRHEKATFKETQNSMSHVVHAGIDYAPNVFLGCYFIRDSGRDKETIEGTGWYHE